jgi:hypothetical protein
MKLPKVFLVFALFALAFAGCRADTVDEDTSDDDGGLIVAPYSYLVADGTTYRFDELEDDVSVVVGILSNADDLKEFANQTIDKNDITELVFGADLSGITSLGLGFLLGYGYLTSLDLSGLSNVTSVSNSFLYGCIRLPSVDLSGLLELVSVGPTFLYNCPALMSITFPAKLETTGITTTGIMGDVPASCALYVPLARLDDYKELFSGRKDYVVAY